MFALVLRSREELEWFKTPLRSTVHLDCHGISGLDSWSREGGLIPSFAGLSSLN